VPGCDDEKCLGLAGSLSAEYGSAPGEDLMKPMGEILREEEEVSEGALISQEGQAVENLVKRFSRIFQALEKFGVPYWLDKVELIGM
jgi:hypothetical protein